jgi:type 1 fimbria pilin
MCGNAKLFSRKHLYFFGGLLFFMFSALQAHASMDYCEKEKGLIGPPWEMQPVGSFFNDGQVIGKRRVSVTYSLPFTKKRITVSGRGIDIPYNAYDTVPLPQTPGVGVRIKWAGANSFGHSMSDYFESAAGTVISKTSTSRPFFGGTAGIGQALIEFSYDYEIVVIDRSAYQGGKLVTAGAGTAYVKTYSQSEGSSIVLCRGGDINLVDALNNELNVPPLPKPTIPTCAVLDLNRSVKMNAVITSQVPDYGSSRSSGAAGEFSLQLVGRSCPQGTRVNAYFTDAQALSASNDYLTSSHPTVGVRLYHGESQVPIQFGPAPQGSSRPSRPAVIEGPVAGSVSDLIIPLTAQYVRFPEVTSAEMKAGSLSARATVVVMYD